MPMINGAHAIIYSRNAEADHAFLRDILELPNADVGHGWLSPRNRRDFVVWIHTVKRSEIRERRMREAAGLLSAGKKLGLK